MTFNVDQDYFGGKTLSECSRVITRHAHLCSRFSKDSEEFNTLLELQEVAQDLLTYIRRAKEARVSISKSRPRSRSKPKTKN